MRYLAIGLFILALASLAGCKEDTTLLTGLNDADANEVLATLQDDGIPAHKKVSKDGVSIGIGEADLSRATAVLNAKGLPRRRQTKLGEVFKKEGLVSSPLEERARYIYALSQELEFTLMQIDGVILSRVHVVLPEKVAPGEPVTPSSAAVFIKHDRSLDADLILPRIRQLVARSIPGLGVAVQDKISVVFVQGTMPAKRAADTAGNTGLVMQVLGIGLILLIVAGLGGLYYRRADLPFLRKSAA
ncbi:EscJ/YscJ/HrcJ family type III secretion inner membrane ring protein [Noviherbaspirillum saxi]|uniref:Lipoprotein n=2 Tax=Noviherbaspirillum saxi TaxID=2320863 RepID=A0A3A3FI04_9BURK|nr:EscJ/YscJ/HrcJ family type III secretion inner membrane ring protein [Noviherbaspirillum saxi]